ncbi:MAG TPA: hypothetical protein VGR45_16425 [Stellaceae bacterium]|nr:hypothetical protein [Stellaceae bacterium]
MSKLWNYVDRCTVGIADGIAATGAASLGIILALWLTGCAQIGKISAADAQNASNVATAVGDSAGAACWQALAATGNAIAMAGNKPAVLTGIEEQRAIQIALQNATCQPVWAGLLGEFLKATPAAPFLP